MLCGLTTSGLTTSDLTTNPPAEGANLVGELLVAALGAFHPAVDSFSLRPIPAATIPCPTASPSDESQNDMRRWRMGIGFFPAPHTPALWLRTDDARVPVGQGQREYLQRLAQLGAREATCRIGSVMLRALAAMHRDVEQLQTL